MPKEKPILFNSEMVQALLAGKKTQTRRIMNPKNHDWRVELGVTRSKVENMLDLPPKALTKDKYWPWFHDEFGDCLVVRCPYGDVGDCLWVRETWRDCNYEGLGAIMYRADNYLRDLYLESRYQNEEGYFNDYHDDFNGLDFSPWYDDVGSGGEYCGWKPSIHMRRWTSRILLEITNVKVERVGMISEGEAEAEGCEPEFTKEGLMHTSATDNFIKLWDSINSKKEGCSWKSNPWVWVVEFKILEVKGGSHE